MSKPLVDQEEFRADVRDILVKCDRNEKIIMLGDFNGWVGLQRLSRLDLKPSAQAQCELRARQQLSSAIHRQRPEPMA
ncbi:hypothetical protein EVAR_27839_1 [Eumeta japonica]|uniref:Craniofacial development protein 2 n=1 Tax=Eumeta variegata TaxID=151549 RepID=A0A4C1VJT2_EUMVA|nr:hypothetical protein EVAR_27839_1 [Eumeta japonica]